MVHIILWKQTLKLYKTMTQRSDANPSINLFVKLAASWPEVFGLVCNISTIEEVGCVTYIQSITTAK